MPAGAAEGTGSEYLVCGVSRGPQPDRCRFLSMDAGGSCGIAVELTTHKGPEREDNRFVGVPHDDVDDQHRLTNATSTRPA